MKKTSITVESRISELGDQDYDLTSYDRKDSFGNSHFQYHNKPKSFTGNKKSTTYSEDYVKTPGLTNPTGVVLN